MILARWGAFFNLCPLSLYNSKIIPKSGGEEMNGFIRLQSPVSHEATLQMESQMNLSGKIALITGGGRGIGQGCALELAKRGADIVLNDRPDSPDLETSAAAIRQLGRACYAIEADAFSRSGCEELL